MSFQKLTAEQELSKLLKIWEKPRCQKMNSQIRELQKEKEMQIEDPLENVLKSQLKNQLRKQLELSRSSNYKFKSLTI